MPLPSGIRPAIAGLRRPSLPLLPSHSFALGCRHRGATAFTKKLKKAAKAAKDGTSSSQGRSDQPRTWNITRTGQIPTGGTGLTRKKFTARESEFLKQREMATAPSTMPDTIALVQPENMETGDFDDDLKIAAVETNTDISDGLSAYNRLKPGDLCELRGGSGVVDLGVYLRSTPGAPTADFLLPSGLVQPAHENRIAFYIPAFVEDISSFIEYFERIEDFDEQHKGAAEPHGTVAAADVTSPIVQPVREFKLRAHEYLSSKSAELNGLYNQLAHETETRRITTPKAASMVFGPEPTNEEIYATHLALIGNGLQYLGDRGYHRLTSNFIVRAKKDVETIDKCTRWIRESTVAFDFTGKGSTPGGPLKTFIDKAVELIDRSRKLLTMSPEQKGVSAERLPDAGIKWGEADRNFIDFMIARLKSYGLQPTPIEGLAPYILRQTGRYTDKTLDADCVYNFLTEIGVYSPWENFVLQQDNQCLPGYNVSSQADIDERNLARVEEKQLADLGLKDCMAGVRKDWGPLKVYCIDDASAEEIDDGISIERVTDNQTWIHVHVANPTAFLPPDHWISSIAKRRTTTKYFQPHVFRMLPRPISSELGVSPGAPVFTFSTKIDNTSGEILDCTVQPGMVRNVQRVTYSQLGEILGIESVPKHYYSVGPPIQSEKSSQASLDADDIRTLRQLEKLTIALTKSRARNGAIGFRGTYLEYQTSNEPVSLSEAADIRSTSPTLYRGFPSIQLSVELEPQLRSASSVVTECMVLANCTVGMYAAKHNIPIPYRTMIYNTNRPEIVKKFKTQILPTRDEWGMAARRVIDDLNLYMQVGYTTVSMMPLPHIFLGLESYTKATSPLRRYSDMIVHWNLQSHLLGRPSLIDREQLTIEIPEFDLKERMANFGSSETKRFWSALCFKRILADEEEKARQIPKEMTMMILEEKRWPTPSVGFINEISITAKVRMPSAAIQKAAQAGDVIRVRMVESKPAERMLFFESDGRKLPKNSF